MDYLGEKVNSLTADALGEVRRKWADRTGGNRSQEQASASQQPPPVSRTTFVNSSAILSDHQQCSYSVSPLSNGIQFGGDTHSSRRSAFRQTPPTIGFRTDLLQEDSTSPSDALHQPPPPVTSSVLQTDKSLDASSESLYQGDSWSRLWFQRVMILCLIRLLLFIRKVYEDFQATKVYNLTGQRGHFLIAATTLFMPTIMFTLYRVARYLQFSLPATRASGQATQVDKQTGKTPGRQTAAARTGADDDTQLRRALMSSPDQSAGMTTPVQNEDEGLVTARQTPINMDEFHDSKSQPGSMTDCRPSSQPPRAPPRRSAELSRQTETKLESVDVDKLGNLPDRESVRLIIGASEQLLHGVLFIFWQLKRQVDVMGYLVERACLWRRPAEQEKEQLNRMNCHRDGLEWFQDFYAAFLAILAQVYTLGLHWSSSTTETARIKQLSATQLNAATSGLSSSDAAGATGDSQSARLVSSLLGLHATLAGKDVLIMSELIVSSAVVFSLLICVRRRDDGPLTLGLSMLGWGSLFAARIIIIALAFVHLGWTLMLPLVVLHVFAITGWIYSIALDSHNGRSSELGDEAKWDEEAALEQQQQQQQQQLRRKKVEGLEMETSRSPVPAADSTTSNGGDDLVVQTAPASITSSWSVMEHVALLVQILGLFAIPSLFYWPIMFNLKLHLRPFKYLVLVLTQNFLLIPAVWFSIVARAEATPGQLYLLGTVGAFSIMGFIFVSLYVACKPSLTEYFARADELFNEADKSGIYFEFCSRVFRMPDLGRRSFRRLMEQTEVIEEVAADEEVDEAEKSSNRVENTQLAPNKTL